MFTSTQSRRKTLQNLPQAPLDHSGPAAAPSYIALRQTQRHEPAVRAFSRIAGSFLLLLLLLIPLVGCKSSPLAAYETAAVAHTTASSTMVVLSQTGQISPDTFRAYDREARVVDVALLAWGQSIIAEYRRPAEVRNFAAIDHLASIARAAVFKLLERYPLSKG